MAICVQKFGAATCVRAEPINGGDSEWEPWRKRYVGRIGQLRLFESRQKYPGQHFLYFDDLGWRLKTSRGELEQEGDRIVFTTDNTRYEFVLLDKTEKRTVLDLISSKTVREYIKSNGLQFSDMDTATIAYNLDLPLPVCHKVLKDISEKTADEDLRRQIEERIAYDLRCIQQFNSNDGGYYYVIEDPVSDTMDDAEQYDSLQLALEHALARGRTVWIWKHSRSELNEIYPISMCRYDASGTVIGYRSDELPEEGARVNDWGAARFESRFVELPNPFEVGDIVRMLDTGDLGIVVTSQKEWQENVQNIRERNLRADFFDASVTVEPLEKEQRSMHCHIPTIFLEKVEREQSPAKLVLQIDYDPERKQLRWNDEDVLPGELYDVLLPDNAGGGVWRQVRFERHEKGLWYVVSESEGFGYPYPQPIGLWARKAL